MAATTVFIVSEDPAVRDSLSELVVSAGLHGRALPSLEAWLKLAESEPGDCLVLDAGTGDLIDPQGCAQLEAACPRTPVLIRTDSGDIPTAVHAIRQGAVDVLTKPVRGQKLLECIERAIAGKEIGA